MKLIKFQVVRKPQRVELWHVQLVVNLKKVGS